MDFLDWCDMVNKDPLGPDHQQLREFYMEIFPQSFMAEQERASKEWASKNSFVTVKPKNVLPPAEAVLFKRRQEFFKKTGGSGARFVKIVPKTAGALRLKRAKKGEK